MHRSTHPCNLCANQWVTIVKGVESVETCQEAHWACIALWAQLVRTWKFFSDFSPYIWQCIALQQRAAQRPHYRGFHPVCRDTPPSFSGMLDQQFGIICWKVVSKVRVVVFKLFSRLYCFCIIPLCQPLYKIFVHQKSLESAQKCDKKW